MSCVRDMGKIMQHRVKTQDRPDPSIYSPMRICTGPCRKRKSITQFTGASALCNQCVLRAPAAP